MMITLAVIIVSLLIFLIKNCEIKNCWLATVTPLSSIIRGSFLISAPLLLKIAGVW